MSITSARNFMEKSGCGLAVGIVIAASFIFGLMQFGSCGKDQNQADQQQQQNVVALAKVGEAVVDLGMVRNYAEAQVQQMVSQGPVTPKAYADIYGRVVVGVVDQAIIRHLAQTRGIKVTNEELKAFGLKQFETQVEGMKEQLINMGKLKKDSTQQQIDEAFKEAVGQDLASARTSAINQFDQQIADPLQRPSLEYQFLSDKLRTAYQASTKVTDEDLKKNFLTYITKRIAFYNKPGSTEDLTAKAEKVLAEIKGGLSFEAAMNKYSDDPGANGKPKSDSTINLDMGTITYDDSYKSVPAMKPGDVSGVLQISSGPAIFKIIRIESKIPADFEKQKETLRKNRAELMGSKELTNAMREYLKGDKIAWSSPGAKALFDLVALSVDPDLRGDKKATLAKLKSLYEGTQALSADKELDPKLLTLAKYGTFQSYYDALPAAEQSAMLQKRLEALEAVLVEVEDLSTRMTVARLALKAKAPSVAATSFLIAVESNAGTTPESEKMYEEQKMLRDELVKANALTAEQKTQVDDNLKRWVADAFEQVKLEAESNVDYSSAGQAVFSDLNAKIQRFSTKGYFTAAQTKELQAMQDKWKAEKVKADKLAAEEAAKAAAEQKKAEEEAKKANSNKPAGGTPPAGTTGGTTGGAGSSNSLVNPGGR